MSLFLQLGLVFMNYRSRPQRMLMEIVYVLTCVKPGVLAYRVAVNAQQEEDSYFDHQQELLITKGVEIFAESIPGCVLQVRPRARERGGLGLIGANCALRPFVNECAEGWV